MDNASKALIMAGGVLLALAAISIALFMVTSVRGYANAVNTVAEVSAVESFNRYYQSFSNPSVITGIDVINLRNRVDNDRRNGHDITCKMDENLYLTLSKATEPLATESQMDSLKSANYHYQISSYDKDGYITSIIINPISNN